MPTKRRGGTRSSEETAAPKADSNMSTKTATAASPATITSSSSINDIAAILWRKYLTETPQRTLLLDAFMGFLVLLALVEFTYCVTFGSYVSPPLLPSCPYPPSYRHIPVVCANESISPLTRAMCLSLAVSRFCKRLYCQRRPVRSHCQLAHADR